MIASVVATISGTGVAQPTPTPTPTPTATVSPTPTATATDVTTSGGGMAMPTPGTFVAAPSPSLAGVAPIASGVNVAANLWPANGTGAIPDGEPNLANAADAAFRFLCAPSHNAYDDPIVYPGQSGKSHLHTFFGNTKTDANSTYASLRTTGDSTCNNPLNRSAYWIAAMMHPSGKVVMPDYLAVYYKRPPSASHFCAPPFASICLPLPRGLRYIFGYNMSDPTKNDPSVYRWFNCDGAGAVPGHFATIKEAAAGCPVGARIGMILVGPNCWNGKDLDSPDHRSHMAFQAQNGLGNNVCPSTHPYDLPFFELQAWYMNDGTAANWKLSSDVAMGTEGGVTAHADWWGAWEDSILARWTAGCIDRGASCSAADLGDGSMLANWATYPLWSQPGAPTLLSPPARAAQ